MHQAHIQLKAMSYHPTFPVGRVWSFILITSLQVLVTSSPDCHRSLCLPQASIQKVYFLLLHVNE